MRIRTGFSFHTAVGHLSDVMDEVEKLGWGTAPISDRMSTFGFVNWTKAALKRNLRPIYGVEIGCVPRFGEKKPTVDYWTFFAKDNLSDLHDLILDASEANEKEPLLTYRNAFDAKGVFAISGERLQVDQLPGDVPEHFYVSLSPSTSVGLARRAHKRGLRFLATGDNYYPRAEDLEFYRVTLGSFRAGGQTYPRHILDDAALREWLSQEDLDASLVDEAFANRDRVMGRCHAELRQAKLLKPDQPKSLYDLCVEGAKQRGVDLADPVYFARLSREVAVIQEKDFEDYFFILADMISYAKTQMVVGPARGSSCGSLVCYLLGITAIDPIPYNLIFERFIDINRTDLPDIDVDFSDQKRDLVFRYAEKKYGSDRVARLGTVGMFKFKSALKQAAAGLQIPSWEIEKLADQIEERDAGDERALKHIEDALAEIPAGQALVKKFPNIVVATKIEGHPNVASQHAAGLLLTNEPITNFVAINTRTRAAWCDKKDAESLNLLKIDALGLTQLSIFERAMELIGVEPTSAFLEALPLDDPKAFEILNQRRFSGVFQFSGAALKRLASQVHFSKMDDVIALTALARPGPMASGVAQEWIERHNGRSRWNAAHPKIEQITKPTYNLVVYQETVMQLVREVGNFTWEDTSLVRRIMGKSQGAEALEKYAEAFLSGAKANGLHPDEARVTWNQIKTMGGYAFNKSHAVAYAVISYWCCWFKAHHPMEFAAATLDAEGDSSKQILLLRELREEGVSYAPFDPDTSTAQWEVKGRTLVGPLTSIKGIGPAKVAQILRERGTKDGISPGLQKHLAAAKTEIDTLDPIRDAYRTLHPNPAESANIVSEPTSAVDIQPGITGSFLFVGLLKRTNVKHENSADAVEKRGNKIFGPDKSLNLFLVDDTDEIMAKIDRRDFERLAPKVLEEAKNGKTLYAIKGDCPRNFRMISVKMIRRLGEMP